MTFGSYIEKTEAWISDDFNVNSLFPCSNLFLESFNKKMLQLSKKLPRMVHLKPPENLILTCNSTVSVPNAVWRVYILLSDDIRQKIQTSSGANSESNLKASSFLAR